ncbi:Uncharacterised protein [Shigella sonnei]|nr:hypothetical protein HmCmsJML149_00653 [Escherichia coli]CSP49303.1 Uncharacterised protein [Shigella sonnei]CSP51288.1 Uncharacterised protein [Shigella sonnei]CSP82160.1 Uncharacterised protein [Shigella sonnei]SVG31547.1 Uncharacterised protein [Shigella sonnei]
MFINSLDHGFSDLNTEAVRLQAIFFHDGGKTLMKVRFV